MFCNKQDSNTFLSKRTDYLQDIIDLCFHFKIVKPKPKPKIMASKIHESQGCEVLGYLATSEYSSSYFLHSLWFPAGGWEHYLEGNLEKQRSV